MSQTVFIMGALVTMSSTRITCPTCEASADVTQLLESAPPKSGYWLRTCRGCGLKLGITTDILGDAVCWDHEAAKARNKRLDALPQPTQAEIDAILATIPAYNEAEEQQRMTQWIADHKASRKSA